MRGPRPECNSACPHCALPWRALRRAATDRTRCTWPATRRPERRIQSRPPSKRRKNRGANFRVSSPGVTAGSSESKWQKHKLKSGTVGRSIAAPSSTAEPTVGPLSGDCPEAPATAQQSCCRACSLLSLTDSVRDPLLVAVRDSGDKLLHVGARQRLLERAREGQKVEQLAARRKLEHHQDHLQLRRRDQGGAEKKKKKRAAAVSE